MAIKHTSITYLYTHTQINGQTHTYCLLYVVKKVPSGTMFHSLSTPSRLSMSLSILLATPGYYNTRQELVIVMPSKIDLLKSGLFTHLYLHGNLPAVFHDGSVYLTNGGSCQGSGVKLLQPAFPVVTKLILQNLLGVQRIGHSP